MYTKALLSVFKGRLYDPLGRNGAIDRCEVSLQEKENEAQCRFTVKMVCNQGVIKTYKLTYEAVDVLHALFDRGVARNRWSMHSSAVREYTEYFGTKTEMLDIFAGEDGRCVFKSYTAKISNGKEILKHPLVTAVAVNTTDFDEFNVQPGLHTIISVKDFKAIVLHADTLKTSLQAYYSHPTRPLQFSYGCDGMICDFTLMTSGDYDGVPPTPTPAPEAHSGRQTSHAPSATTETVDRSSRSDMPPRQHADNRSFRSGMPPPTDNRSFGSDMPPPTEPPARPDRVARLRNPGTRQNSVAASQQSEQEDDNSLFIPDPEEARRQQEEEDSAWAPLDYEREETLEWDGSGNRDASGFATFRDSGVSRTNTVDSNEVFEATQRVSQIQGLW